MSGFETEFNFHKWPNEKPVASGRYLVYCYEEVVPDHADEEPYTIDPRWIICYYSVSWGWDAAPKVIAWTSLPPDLPDPLSKED